MSAKLKGESTSTQYDVRIEVLIRENESDPNENGSFSEHSFTTRNRDDAMFVAGLLAGCMGMLDSKKRTRDLLSEYFGFDSKGAGKYYICEITDFVGVFETQTTVRTIPITVGPNMTSRKLE